MSMLHQVSSAFNSLLGRVEGSDIHAASLAPKKEITVKSIYIHPIKSCKGSQVDEAQLTNNGLLYDRTWLIIDSATKRFCTAREFSQMVLITPRIDLAKRKLIIEVPLTEQGRGGTVTVQTDLDPTKEMREQMQLVQGITIWNHTVDGYAVSAEADRILSQFFGKPVMLVRKGPLDRPSGPDDRRRDATLNFQDFYPLLIATQASLEHVQQTLVKSIYPAHSSFPPSPPPSPPREGSRFAVEIPQVKVSDRISREHWTPERLETLEMTRFRPNLILDSVSTSETPALIPWEEDGFVELDIFNVADPSREVERPPLGPSAKGRGKLGISCMARAGRCLVPNVDPETGNRDAHIPYQPMQKFRQVEPIYTKIGKPCFGVLAAMREDPRVEKGIIRVGDIVRVTQVTDPATRRASQK